MATAETQTAREVVTEYFDALSEQDLDRAVATWKPGSIDDLYGFGELARARRDPRVLRRTLRCRSRLALRGPRHGRRGRPGRGEMARRRQRSTAAGDPGLRAQRPRRRARGRRRAHRRGRQDHLRTTPTQRHGLRAADRRPAEVRTRPRNARWPRPSTRRRRSRSASAAARRRPRLPSAAPWSSGEDAGFSAAAGFDPAGCRVPPGYISAARPPAPRCASSRRLLERAADSSAIITPAIPSPTTSNTVRSSSTIGSRGRAPSASAVFSRIRITRISVGPR